ncbi:MAG: L,D-transpeptidase family protein [Myxococcota bacterium]
MPHKDHHFGRCPWATLLTGLAAGALLMSGCAHGPAPPSHPEPTISVHVAQNDAHNADIAALNAEWSRFKGSLTEQQGPWTLTQSDTAAALAESRLTGSALRALEKLYNRRGHTSVFFYRGRLTRAGQRANHIASTAWTHGIAKPDHWPDQLDVHRQQHREAHQAITNAISAPLPLGDIERMHSLGELRTDHLSPEALEQVQQIQTLQAQARTLSARIDGALVSALWQLAEATRRHDIVNRWAKPIRIPKVLYTAPDRALDAVAPSHDDYQRLTKAYARYWELHARQALKPLPAGLRTGVKFGQEHAELPFLRDRLEAEGFLPGNPLATDITTALAYAAQKEAEMGDGTDPTPDDAAVDDEDDGTDASPEADPVQDIYADPDGDQTASSTASKAVDALGEPIVHDDRFVLDETLRAQLLSFQFTRGLDLTGELDEETYVALNVPTDHLLHRLELGLMRWQASHTRTKKRYVRAAINQFELQLVDQGRVRKRYKAVVGRPARRTPRLVGTITHMVLYPWWWGTRNSPSATPPGPDNPLGLLVLKIDPANTLVYVHGTNSPELLNEPYRYYSSGCVRLLDPTELAGILLDEDPAPETAQDLHQLMERQETLVVHLAEHVPVFMEYNTTFVRVETGHAHFTRDIYRLDRHMLPRLRDALPLASTWNVGVPLNTGSVTLRHP